MLWEREVEQPEQCSPGLFPALGIRRRERVALVGAGGKTSLGYRLLQEAGARGWTALFTTTTKLLSPEEGAGALRVGEIDLPVLRQLLQSERQLLLARRWLDVWEGTPAGRQRKVEGFSPQEIEHLVNNLDPDLAVVEADGSRHRPLKAPDLYEPVIPPGTTLLVVMAGLSVVGRPLDEASVHRPARVSELGGRRQGEPVDAALVAAVLAHPEGGLKGCPPPARAAAVLAQATAARLPDGRQAARLLLREERFERVLLADLEGSLLEVWRRAAEGVQCEPGAWPRVHAVVLAAGTAERMGRNKLLLPLGDRPLLAHAVDAALGSRAAAVWVVVGDAEEQLRRALGTRPVRVLSNPQHAEGQAASLRAAVEALGAAADGLLFLAGDMPFVQAAHLDQLMARLRPGAAVVWTGYEEDRGVPALFGREAFAALRELGGDTGGRALAGRFPEAIVRASFPLLDVDTAEAYEEARQWLESASLRQQAVREAAAGPVGH